MKESVFRKKSLDKISSPEEIDEYMKVTSPSLWMIFGAVLLVLIAVVIWSITKEIEASIVVDGQVVTEMIKPIELLLN